MRVIMAKKVKGKKKKASIASHAVDVQKMLGKLDSREKLFRKQRKEFGWDDRDTWSLDHRISQFVLPRLERFNEIRGGHPANMENHEWGEIVEKMIYAHRAIAAGEHYGNEVDMEKVQEGLDLFGQYYLHLWW